MPTSCTIAASTPARNDCAQIIFRVGQFVFKNERVERDVAFDAAPVEKFHQLRQIGLGEIMRAHPGVELVEAEINRVRAVFHGGLGAFPIAGGREQFRHGAELKGFRFTQTQVEEADGAAYWPLESGVEPKRTNGWLAFIDPFHLDAETWIRAWNQSYAPLPVFGGLASGIFSDQTTQVYLNGEVFEDGGVAISVGGDVKLSGVISQGCTPIGETWTLTRVEQNLIHQIANRPAYAVLAETVQQLSPADQQKARGNLFIGLVVNEYLEDFHRGDFLVRNLIGGDPNSGVLAVGALPRAGQTMQFHRRDAAAATEDMDELLERAKEKLGGATIYGGCLCCCNGRGKNLFGTANHDAELVQSGFGPIGLAGFYGNGEIGPVGEKNYLHGFTASLALFVKK
jgi:small ligand-binding sensory domain FIST